MKVQFSFKGINDLKRLREFIAINNPENASKVAGKIIGAINNLTQAPQIGKRLESFSKEVRELCVGRYVFRYLIEEECVVILNIWHTKESR
jgi:plasmid stabilization system protein ParE